MGSGMHAIQHLATRKPVALIDSRIVLRKSTRLMMSLVTATLCALMIWAILAFMQTEQPRGLEVASESDARYEGIVPDPLIEPPVPVDGYGARVLEEQLAYILIDKITGAPLVGVLLESEAGVFGPTTTTGEVRIPASATKDGWYVRLNRDFGSRQLSVELPCLEGAADEGKIVVAATSRMTLTLMGANERAEKSTSVIFAPAFIDSITANYPDVHSGIAHLLCQSPSMAHDWLVKASLSAGLSGILKAEFGEVVTFIVNQPGVYNIAASSSYSHGTTAIEAFAGEASSAVLTMAESTIVSGLVVYQDGTPLPNADIRIVCSKRILDGELMPKKSGTGGTIHRNKLTGDAIMSLDKNLTTDASGRFAWPFDITDGILIWAFYRDAGSERSGCGYIVARAGEARDPTEMIVTVTNSIPFGTGLEIKGGVAREDDRPYIVFVDRSLEGPNVANSIVIPAVLRDDRLVIDMLPFGQECTFVSRGRRTNFRAAPGVEVFMK